MPIYTPENSHGTGTNDGLEPKPENLLFHKGPGPPIFLKVEYVS